MPTKSPKPKEKPALRSANMKIKKMGKSNPKNRSAGYNKPRG